ncbi:cysteine hydrolase family protein [Effusibacillus pohliae]|uniref:cysteine hydrolase family protein n=1 Tax=Effusibacillus pohliae TaxID=232270 RepID=UPI00037EAF92|nr:isochorismatase family protein [Effusibacillus pohliae]
MKKALLLIDVQEDFLGNLGNLDYIVRLSQQYLDQNANEYDLIITTTWKYEDNEGKDTLLISHPKAKRVEKRTYSAFNEEVKKLLEEHQIELVHLGGMDAEMAVMATMYSLLDNGYKVQILEPLLASYHARNWEATTIMKHVLGEENVLRVGGDRVWV